MDRCQFGSGASTPLLQRRIGLCGDATRAPTGACKQQKGRTVFTTKAAPALSFCWSRKKAKNPPHLRLRGPKNTKSIIYGQAPPSLAGACSSRATVPGGHRCEEQYTLAMKLAENAFVLALSNEGAMEVLTMLDRAAIPYTRIMEPQLPRHSAAMEVDAGHTPAIAAILADWLKLEPETKSRTVFYHDRKRETYFYNKENAEGVGRNLKAPQIVDVLETNRAAKPLPVKGPSK
jgi:hypothetical protein